MTLNIIIKVKFTKYLLIILFSVFVNSTLAQCWGEGEFSSGYNVNTVYSLDSLIVSKKMSCVLDHSIALLDSFDVNKNDTWIYYVICLSSIYNNDSGTKVKIELQQGVDYNIFFDRLFPEGDTFYGAFCYKGYTFFVLCDYDNIALFKDLFHTKNKKDFFVYYNTPFVSGKWEKMGYPNMLKFIYLFYQYKDGSFSYITTSFSD